MQHILKAILNSFIRASRKTPILLFPTPLYSTESKQKLNRVGLLNFSYTFFEITIIVAGCFLCLPSCQSTEPRTFGYTYFNTTSNYSLCETYSKSDTAYSDTSITKNTNTKIVNSIAGINTATISGSQLLSSIGTLSITGSISTVTGFTQEFTITGTTLTGCKTIINIVELEKNLPNPMPRPVFEDFAPDSSKSALSVMVRNGTQNTVQLTSLAGSLMGDVPPDLLRLFTLGNKELQSTLPTDSINGWLVYQITALDANTGNIDDITDAVTLGIQKAASGVFTYFPDGYYTFVSNVDSSFNQYGWFQISMSGNTPLAVIYYPRYSGQYFTEASQFPGQEQLNLQAFGYGVWGIGNFAYFPLIRLARSRQAILRAIPVKYKD